MYTNSPYVATLLADPARMKLRQAEADSAVDALQASGAIVEAVNWLAPDAACDIFFAVLPLDEARELLAHLLAEVPFDAIVQPARGRRKKLLVCDMDSTIIQQECIDEMADMLGLKSEISAITERAMRGELDFKAALRERVAMLKGLRESELLRVFEERITLTPGAKTLVQTMRRQGARTVLVSGGFTFFTGRVQALAGFDVQEANILEIENGALTGKVREPILDSEVKLGALHFHAEELGISLAMTMAAGDGANDLPMLQVAGLGVAYHAKPKVREQTAAKLDTCDLTALLYAQGYGSGDMVPA